jgi:hypothetical protein
MSTVNAIIGAVLSGILTPFESLSPLVGLALISAISAGVMLLVVKWTSNQARLAAVKRSIQACVYEVRLFGDDARAIVRALLEMARHNVTYLGLSLVPLLWMAVPFGLLLTHLDGYYGLDAPTPGHAVLVKVKMSDANDPSLRLEAPAGVRIETPVVRIPSLHEAVWRVSAEQPGRHDLTVVAGAARVTKEFTTAPGVVRRSAVRPEGSVFNQAVHPAERPTPSGSAIESITVTYPTRSIGFFGWNIHWLVAYFGLSLVFALFLRPWVKVTL